MRILYYFSIFSMGFALFSLCVSIIVVLMEIIGNLKKGK